MTETMACCRRLALAACVAGVTFASASAHAGLFDSLFGGKAQTAQVDPAQRLWRMGEFTTIQLVPREPGAGLNQHPARVSGEALRWTLGGVRVNVDGGNAALLSADEVGELAEPLAQALAVARPEDDIVLLSTSRRGASFLTTATGVTARLFVQDGRLQLIVRDARLEFIKQYIASKATPTFNYGSRSIAGNAVLAYSEALVRRADWLALPLTLPGAAAASTPVLPVVQPAAPAAPAAVVAAPAAATAPAVRAAPVAEAPQTEAEARLQTLKRLRDRGLISEEEFQDKRKEVLKLL